MDSNECQNCGKKLPERTETRGRKRIYCSGSCRAQAATRRKEVRIEHAAFDFAEEMRRQNLRSQPLIEWHPPEVLKEVSDYLEIMSELAFKVRREHDDFKTLAQHAQTFLLAAELAGLWHDDEYVVSDIITSRVRKN